MSEERKMSPSEIIDFIENKVQIDVRLLSAEEINKTTEVFGCAIEMIERAELMQAELEKAHDEAVKDFCHFLIDKAEGGSIAVDELPDLVVEWGSPSRKSAGVKKEVNEAFSGSHKGKGKVRESDAVALLRIVRSIKAKLKRAREIPYIQRPYAWALYHVWREEDCKK